MSTLTIRSSYHDQCRSKAERSGTALCHLYFSRIEFPLVNLELRRGGTGRRVWAPPPVESYSFTTGHDLSTILVLVRARNVVSIFSRFSNRDHRGNVQEETSRGNALHAGLKLNIQYSVMIFITD